MITVATKPIKPRADIRVPGSKSYTHRWVIAAALSNGPCRIANPLRSQDTRLTMQALQQLGIAMEDQPDAVLIQGAGGRFNATDDPIFLGNSGTSMRLLGGLVVLGEGRYRLTGVERMCQRPIQDLIDSLQLLGITAYAEKGNGCPPLIVEGGNRKGGRTRIDCTTSSQYLSSLLLLAPCLEQGLIVDVDDHPVSKPYIDMTVDVMTACGIDVAHDGYRHFEIAGNQTYQYGDYAVEPDASQAGYFWAAAAITGSSVKVKDVTTASRQGDVGLADIFGRMGCRVDHGADGITVTGGRLKAVDVDMGHLPDMVPTLAVVAAFAEGTTIIRNVAHLKVKESDRLAAVAQELGKMGIAAHCGEDELRIEGGRPTAAVIDTYDDHRIAMSFGIAGLKVPGVSIENEGCVAKSFPDFWQVLGELYQ